MDNEAHLIEIAQKKRLLTKKQAGLIEEMIHQHRDVSAGDLMLARHYVTEDQLNELRNDHGGGEAYDTQQISPGGKLPGQLSVGDMNRQRRNLDEAPSSSTEFDDEPLDAQETFRAPYPNEAEDSHQQESYEPEPEPYIEEEPEPAAPVYTAPNEDPTLDEQSAKKRLAQLLHFARHWGASDLHITVGRPPMVRLNGTMMEMQEPVINAADSRLLSFAGLKQVQVDEARSLRQYDFALEIPKLGRHRCSIFKQRLGWDAVFRVVLNHVPTMKELGLPDSLRQLTQYHQGLVMLAGPGRSGKTTTAAALLDIVNTDRQDHIITIEDPIEYIIPPKDCQITQREVGRHTQSYGNALRAALREDPDILLIGEMRDLSTAAIAISAAETGHLVFATMNTGSAARTVATIVDFYPSTQQKQVLTMVAESLRGVVTQQLLPRIDGNGMVLALEILINIPGIAQQIKEGKTQMITSLIQSGKKFGMVMMDESLLNLVSNNIVPPEEAYIRAVKKENFERFLKK